MHVHGAEVDLNSFIAVRYGHLDIITYVGLHSAHGAEWTQFYLWLWYGHMDIITYVVHSAHGAEVDLNFFIAV
jgi:hypothetical protein